MAGLRWIIDLVSGALAAVNPVVLWASFGLSGLGIGYGAYRAINQSKQKKPVKKEVYEEPQTTKKVAEDRSIQHPPSNQPSQISSIKELSPIKRAVRGPGDIKRAGGGWGLGSIKREASWGLGSIKSEASRGLGSIKRATRAPGLDDGSYSGENVLRSPSNSLRSKFQACGSLGKEDTVILAAAYAAGGSHQFFPGLSAFGNHQGVSMATQHMSYGQTVGDFLLNIFNTIAQAVRSSLAAIGSYCVQVYQWAVASLYSCCQTISRMLAPVIQRIAQALSPYYLAISTRLSQWFQAFMAGVRWAIGFVNGAFAGVNPIVLWASLSIAGLSLGYVAYKAIKQRRLKKPVENDARNAKQRQDGTLEVAEEAQSEGKKGNERALEVAEEPQSTKKIVEGSSIQHTANSQASQTSPMPVARALTPTKNNAVLVSNGQPKSPGSNLYSTYHVLENLGATDILTVAALFREPTARNSISRYQAICTSHDTDAITLDSLFAEAEQTRYGADRHSGSNEPDAADTLTDSGLLQEPRAHQSSMQPKPIPSMVVPRMVFAFIASWIAYLLWERANGTDCFAAQYGSSNSEHAGHKICDRVRPGENHAKSDVLVGAKIGVDAKGASSAHQAPSLLVSAIRKPIGPNEPMTVSPCWSPNSYIQFGQNGSYCGGPLTSFSLIRCDQAVYSVYPDQVQSYVVDLDGSTEQEFYTLSQYGQKTCLDDDDERQIDKTVSGAKPSSEIFSTGMVMLGIFTGAQTFNMARLGSGRLGH